MCSFNVLMSSLNISTASSDVTSTLDFRNFLFNYLPTIKVYIIGVFLRRMLLSVSDEESYFILSIFLDDLVKLNNIIIIK